MLPIGNHTEAVHKNNSVSGRPAGWLKKVRLETFFFIFAKFLIFFPKIDNIFMEKKNKVEKKKIAIYQMKGYFFLF